MSEIWKRAESAIKVGSEVAKCRVKSFDDKGFTLERASGKTVRITRRMCEETAARLLSGEMIAKHANRSKGGISYTSAIEMGVIAALAGLARLAPCGKAWEMDASKAQGLQAA